MKRIWTSGICALALTSIAFSGCGGKSGSSIEPATPHRTAPSEPAAKPAPVSEDVKPEGAAPAQTNEGMAAPAPASAPAAPEAAAPAAPAEPAPAPAAVPAGETLTKDTIVGKKFTTAGMVFDFEKDGVLKVSGGGQDADGTWSMEGTTVTVTAMGTEYKAEIQGDTIAYNGTPLEKVQ